MSLHGLSPWTLLLIGAITLAVVVVMYTVRWRVPQRVVATLSLWTGVMMKRRGGGRLGAFDSLLSLLLHAFIAASLVLSLGRPRLGCQTQQGGRSVMVVLDRSASMGTIERFEPRLDIAKRRALSLLGTAAASDMFGMVRAGGAPELALPLGLPGRLREAVETTSLRIASGQLERAVSLGCDLLAGFPGAALIVITDGSEPLGRCDGVAIETVLVGTEHPNLGITSLSTGFAPRDPEHAEAYVEVTNAAPSAARAELRLALDGRLLRVVPLELASGEQVHRIIEEIPLNGGERLEARLSNITFADKRTDVLAEDDVAYSVISRRPVIAVDLIGEDPWVQAALGSNPRFAVTRRARRSAASAITVVVGKTPEPLGAGRYLVINPSGEGFPFTVGPLIHQAAIEVRDEAHPLLRRVVLSDVFTPEVSELRLPSSAKVLARGALSPLVFTLLDGQQRLVGLNFGPESNLALRVAFPVLIYNSIDWLLSSSIENDDEALSFRTNEALDVTSPEGKKTRMEPVEGRVLIEPARVGFFRASLPSGEAFKTVAVTLSSASETSLSPRKDVPASAQARFGTLRNQEPMMWILALALLLLAAEWLSFHRRITV